MEFLFDSLLQLITETSTNLPPDVRAAMVKLAKSRKPEELADEAFRLYEAFRPAVPAGELGDIELLCWAANAPTPTVPPTPTATSTPPPSASPTASAVPTRIPTRTASPTSTREPSRTPTAPPSPTETAPPMALYLPLVLTEHCRPGTQRIDVALVIDASTSMRDDRTAAGRTKRSAALELRNDLVLHLDAGRTPIGPDQHNKRPARFRALLMRGGVGGVRSGDAGREDRHLQYCRKG